MRIGVLECDHVDPGLVGTTGDYVDMFAALLPELDLVPYDVRGGVVPSAADECSGWICTGSRSSVVDDEGWIHAASTFVRQVRAAHVPFVGVCFGHQLIAHALGGRVERAPAWGVGAHRTTVTRVEPWMDPALDAVTVLYTHQDQVVSLPTGGRVLAAADHCPIAMLGVDDTMLGIQGHPEFDAAYLDALMAGRVERVGAERVAAARASLYVPRDEETVAEWIAAFLHT